MFAVFAVSAVLTALVFYIKSQHSPYPIGFRPCEMLQCPQDQSQAPSSPGQSAANPENPSKNRIPQKAYFTKFDNRRGPPQETNIRSSPIFKNCFFLEKSKKLRPANGQAFPKLLIAWAQRFGWHKMAYDGMVEKCRK